MKSRTFSQMLTTLVLLLPVFLTGRPAALAAYNSPIVSLPLSAATVIPHGGNFPGWRSYPTPGNVATLAIEGNVIWVGTIGGGVLKLDISTGTTLAAYNTGNSAIASNNIVAIAVDGAGNKWFGTAESGVSKFDNRSFTTYNLSNSRIASNNIKSIAIDKNQVVWVGTLNNGASSFDGHTWKTYNTGNSAIAFNHVNGIVVDAANVKWFALSKDGYDGCSIPGALSKFNGSSWVNYIQEINSLETLALDKAGNKWAGLSMNDRCEGVGGYIGSAQFNEATGKFDYPNSPSVGGYSIAFDNNNVGWFGFNEGVQRYDGTHVTDYFVPSGTPGLKPIAIDAYGNKWIGLSDRVSVLNETRPFLQATTNNVGFVTSVGNPASPQLLGLGTYNLDVNWKANITYGSGATGWLSLDNTSGLLTYPSAITLTASVNSGNLAAGTYTATVTFTDIADTSISSSTNVSLSITPTPDAIYTYTLPALTHGSFYAYHLFQNIGTGPATIQTSYVDLTGTAFINPPGTCVTIATHGECIESAPVYAPPYYFGESENTITLISDQPLNIVTASSLYGAVPLNAPPISSNELIAPLMLNNAFGNYKTELNIVNPGPITTTAYVSFYDNNGQQQTTASRSLVLPPGQGYILQQGDDPFTTGLARGFNGWAKISTLSANQVVAQVIEENFYTHFTTVFNVQPASSIVSNTTLYAPAIFNGAFGSFVTGSSILNPNTTPVTVTLTYYDNSGNAIPTAPYTIAAGSQSNIYQGSASGGNGLPPNGLPKGFYGSLKITSEGGGITMLVNEVGPTTYPPNSNKATSSQSGTYLAVPSGSSQLNLPVISNGAFGYVTGLTVLNTSGVAVMASLQYYNLDGSAQGSPVKFEVGAYSSQPYYQGAAGLPPNFYGTAVITQLSGPTGSLIVTTNATSSTSFYSYTEPN